ncbi:MAG: succinate dehydrogenase [Bacilli bacterium]|nr:succinate dehydrogenase [Bacilli bacterium]
MEHREYFNRRLHSLLGVVPIGIFVVQHLIINHFIVYGEESYNKAAGFMGNLPFVLALEIFVIYLPLIFHAVLGVYIAFTAKYNLGNYKFGRNWAFFFQRITGIIALIFIVWHVWQTRVQVALGNAEVNADMMYNILQQPFYFWFYIISILAIVYHLANGLWGFVVSWGIAQSPKSQRFFSYVSVLVFVVVSYIGIRTVIEFGL